MEEEKWVCILYKKKGHKPSEDRYFLTMDHPLNNQEKKFYEAELFKIYQVVPTSKADKISKEVLKYSGSERGLINKIERILSS